MVAKSKKGKEISFEASMERLNDIVSKLESDDLSLEDSIKLYEEGSAHISICNNYLKDAETKIELIRKNRQSTTEIDSGSSDQNEDQASSNDYDNDKSDDNSLPF